MTKPGSNVVSISHFSPTALQGEVSAFLINQIQLHLFPILKPSLSSLIDYIVERTDAGTSNSKIMEMMEVQQKLKRSKEKIIDNFKQVLIGSVEDWAQNTISDSLPPEDDKLCLLDNEALELKLAWQRAARQIELCDELQHLYNLESRLQHITKTTPEINPVGAYKIAESFASTLSAFEFDLDISQDIMLYFSQHIKKSVIAIWVETDKYLAELGLELHKNSKEANKQPAQTLTDNCQYSHPVERPVASELIYALTSIQGELSQQNACLSTLPDSIKERLSARGMQDNLSPRHEDLINIIGMLFEFILDDHELPEEVKNLVGLLQIPVLKLALLDKAFLTDRNHPGRMLLNIMTTSGMHCTEPDNPIIDLISRTVKTIFKNFIDQSDIFSQCLESFNIELAVIEESNPIGKTSSLDEITTAVDSNNSDQITGSQHSFIYDDDPVDLILATYRSRHDIPELLDDMVAIGWRQIFEHAWQQDLDDDNWFFYVNTLEMLLWDIAPDRQQNLSREHWETLKSYVIRLLNDIGFNPSILADWLQAINTLTTHRLSFIDEEIIIAEEATSNYVETDNPLDDFDEPDETFEEREQDHDQLPEEFAPINNLRAGQLVEFIGKNNRRLCCKLTRIDEGLDRYIFENKSGMKVSEWSRADLERGILENKIRILNNTQFFDRALQAVMDNFLKF